MYTKYDLSGLARAVCLDEEQLSDSFAKDLQELHRMLEDAIRSGHSDAGQEPELFPPAYGMTAVLCTEEEVSESGKAGARTEPIPGSLRPDKAEPCPMSVIRLSHRQDGKYISVPQVVPQ